eukprot:Gb_07334 [translate_table: standard]
MEWGSAGGERRTRKGGRATEARARVEKQKCNGSTGGARTGSGGVWTRSRGRTRVEERRKQVAWVEKGFATVQPMYRASGDSALYQFGSRHGVSIPALSVAEGL